MWLIKLVVYQIYDIYLIRTTSVDSPQNVIDSPDKELFANIESVLSREQGQPITEQEEPDVEETADKFKRLNLFFDKEQVCLVTITV